MTTLPVRVVARLAALSVLVVAACLSQAGAATITQVSPQGEVAQVAQLVVRFSEAVVPMGDARQADPVSLDCQGTAVSGSGRWNSEREWVFDFKDPLPPGTRCRVQRRPGWKPLSGELTGTSEYHFNTGGPAVRRITPWQGSTVEEDQLFILELTGPVVESTLATQAWCEVEGLGERLPVALVAGSSRAAVLKSRHLDKLPAERLLLLGCGRPLAPGAKLRLVWGKGIAARGPARLLTTVEQRFDFQVRPAFSAEFSCERERANAPCMPIRPLLLRFSSPVPRALAEQARLQPRSGAALSPSFDKDDKSAELSELRFIGPLAENAAFTITLPPGLKDVSGRPLANAASFPMAVATGGAPPIAKFAAAPFGVLERSAETLLPLTLRHVQGDLRPQAGGGQVRIKRLGSDADVITWYRKLRRYHETQLSAQELGMPRKDWTELVEERNAQGKLVRRQVERQIATREVSLLAAEPGARRLELPQLQGGDPRPFEVVGIPLPDPGYHVVEIESRRLGQALLDKAAPMFVRTGVLVTNLGVHFKQGRENAAVWVTSLDRGLPVAGADVALSDCQGRALWAGTTDAKGLVRVPRGIEADERCSDDEAVFVSARKADTKGVVDMAFVFNGWVRGIEPWRFNVAVSSDPQPELRAHTVFDRTLLRAGETLSMKHFIRRENLQGLALLPASELPTRLKIVHEGSDQTYTQPLSWAGARSSTSTWNIPPGARLGLYRVELDRPEAPEKRRRSWTSGEFRVEEFRVPLVDAQLLPPKAPALAPTELVLGVQLRHLSGGGVAQAALRGSALLRPRAGGFAGQEDFSFEPPRAQRDDTDDGGDGDDGAQQGVLVADKQALQTDRDGAARFTISGLPKLTRASEVVAEIAFNDPNGEVQTVSTTVPVWPSAVVPGIKAASWAQNRGQAQFTALALDTQGKPLAGQALEVRARLWQTLSSRKRLVGGFYAYDNRRQMKDLGALCSGKTDAQGRLSCDAKLDSAGQVELVVSGRDAAGRVGEAATSIWVTRQGELWFEQDNDDRIDVLPEKKRYEPGETARFQVRMPFRQATALVAVEREGVIDTQVLTLRGDDPGFDLKIDPGWAPNVYVSVLALRGRIRDLPWTSFFDWGWKAPVEWARAFWYEGHEYQAPTALVDLSRPAFKLGVAAIKVGLAAHELQVSVQPDKSQYAVRGKAMVRVKVSQGGQPAAGADLAFAAVDEGLLALSDNRSWQLLSGLLQERAWGVQTATAQNEIIGRRHYGRKAVAAGGGGGKAATRELFDTLLLWRPRVALDAKGEALVEVPLNDSLTAFRLVAVADDGGQRFGTGSASIRVTQDLQLLSGLPPLVRDGDRFSAMLTLRNTTTRAMKLRVTLQGTANSSPTGGAEITRTPLNLPPQDVDIAAGGARELLWPVDVPAEVFSISWDAAVQEQGGAAASDRLKITQQVGPAQPLRVLQATLSQLDGSLSLPVAAPADALPASGPKRGGLVLGVQPRLGGALPGIRRYFETYPFSCLEQKAAKALGLRDAALWAQLGNGLASYLDDDGLANYFPPRAEDGARGSDRLTAHLLAAAHEAGFELPPVARDRMLDGLVAFVDGRIQRKFYSPRADLDVRKLAAVEALARYGRVEPRMLGSIKLQPNLWPTAAVIDWLQILRRLPAIAEQPRRIDEAQQILRSRISYAGTTLRFSNEADDYWWWLMDSADANAARLILALIDDPAWKDELPRLVLGALGRQQGGAWLTTTANLWGALALDKFSARFENTPVSGVTLAGIGAAKPVLDWSRSPQGGRVTLPWPTAPATLQVTQQGSGKPWVTVQGLAAIALQAPLNAGYAVTRSVTAVTRQSPDRWSRGDVLRVRLQIDAQADRTWVVVADPVPGGATLLGSGLGRDSQIATRDERQEGNAWPSFVERGFDAWRGYYGLMPRGRHVVEYTLRLNNPGRFLLPPTRVEALYAPESFGESPNAPIEVAP
ncbi:MAG: alpha-2-macroglobulin [Rubrivivax sp.]|nr:alpha-2-macroglobulin [Rubrivivax sp.]